MTVPDTIHLHTRRKLQPNLSLLHLTLGRPSEDILLLPETTAIMYCSFMCDQDVYRSEVNLLVGDEERHRGVYGEVSNCQQVIYEHQRHARLLQRLSISELKW